MAKKTERKNEEDEVSIDETSMEKTEHPNNITVHENQESGGNSLDPEVETKNPTPEGETPASEANTQEKKDAAEENASQGDGSNENQDVRSMNQDTEVESLVELAAQLKKHHGVKEVYRTKDGQWFTKKEYADQHKQKVGGLVDPY